MKHPIQKTHMDDDVFRFVHNDVVYFMKEKLREFGYDLNDLHVDCHEASPDDWDQFNQLIGYSVSAIPLNNMDIHEIAYDGLVDGKLINDDPNTITSNHYEEKYKELKKQLAPIIADMYNKHPDDLI